MVGWMRRPVCVGVVPLLLLAVIYASVSARSARVSGSAAGGDDLAGAGGGTGHEDIASSSSCACACGSARVGHGGRGEAGQRQPEGQRCREREGKAHRLGLVGESSRPQQLAQAHSVDGSCCPGQCFGFSNALVLAPRDACRDACLCACPRGGRRGLSVRRPGSGWQRPPSGQVTHHLVAAGALLVLGQAYLESARVWMPAAFG